MNKLILLFLIMVLGIASSCDSKKYKKDLLNQSVSRFKNSITPIETASFIPQENKITVTDTILSNHFKFKIMSSANMDQAILKQNTNNQLTKSLYYRKSIVKLQLYYKDELIFDNDIDTAFLKNNTNILTKIGKDDLIIRDLNLDQKTFITNKKAIYFSINAYNPNHELDFRINLHIDKTGKYTMHTTKSYPI
ncbi:hypothetical protein [Postechiella marina]